MGLRTYIITRILLMIPMILLLLSIVFVVVRIMPGDPVALHFERRASEESMNEMRTRLGLNKPLYIQYFEYLGGLLRGDFGISMQDYSPVGQQIFSAFPATLELAIFSVIIAITLGVLLGVRASKSYNSPQDHFIRAFGIIAYAIPVFFLGMIFQLIFAVELGWFPTGLRTKPTMEPYGLIFNLNYPSDGLVTIILWALPAGLICCMLSFIVLKKRNVNFWPKGFLFGLLAFFASMIVWSFGSWYLMSVGEVQISTGLFTIDSLLEGNIVKFVEALKGLFLPSLTLGIVLSGVFVRLTRNNMLETLRLEYVTAAKARGLKERAVVYGYAFRNAFLPILTMMGLQFATLLGGAILTETTFSWPGLGRYLVSRINYRDYTAIQGAVVYFGLIVALVSLIVDIFYAYLDPRIRL
jgi:ABC-type dipeptide/oligopeptide/nickel transport system permease component